VLWRVGLARRFYFSLLISFRFVSLEWVMAIAVMWAVRTACRVCLCLAVLWVA
jgi:hypothetical protein